MGSNISKLALQEKLEELGDFVDTKLAATWLDIMLMRKLYSLPAEDSEKYAITSLIDFAVDIARSNGMSKDDLLKQVSAAYDAFDRTDAEEEDNDNVVEEDEQ